MKYTSDAATRRKAGLFAGAAMAAFAVTAFPASLSAQEEDDNACEYIEDEAAQQECLERVDPAGIARDGALPTVLDATVDTGEGETIVVTGSRLRRSEFNSPDPISIISPDLARKTGATDAAELLQNSPLASGSTQITDTLSSNFVTDGGVGAQTISLRGLGANRTLVLLNGRRAGPAGTRGAVSSFDLNVLPISIIENVEILKTGASSIYGSDAVAGVVNIRTKEDLDGFDGSLYASPTFEGGGETYQASLAYGKTFDRGHFLLAGDYYRRNELERRDREYLDCQEEYLFFEDGTRADLRDPRTGEFACNGAINNLLFTIDYTALVGNLIGVPTPSNLRAPNGRAIQIIQPNNPGDRLDEFLPPIPSANSPFQFGAPANFFPVNFDGPSTGIINQYPLAEQRDSVIPESNRYTAYFQGAYDITDDIEVFATGLYNKRQTRVDGSRQLFFIQYTGSGQLPLLFGDSGSFFAGDPLNDEFSGNALLQPVISVDAFDQDVEVDYYRGVLGARGGYGGLGFLADWNWELYGQYSLSDGTYASDIIFQDAVDAAEFRTELCAGTTTAVRGVPCIDIDYTDPRVLAGNFNAEERAFLFGRDVGNTEYTQATAEFFTSGGLFQLPGGTVQVGVGAQYRRDEIEDVPGEATLNGNSFGLTGSGITAGFSNSYEVFGELEIPLLGGMRFVEDLTLSAAGRFTRVDSERASDGLSDSDEDFTYKLGANWQVTDWLRFRGSYGTSFRTPALYEQFLQDQTGFLGQLSIDPCINYGTGLEQGTTSQRVADNCAADGVPADYPGGGSSAEIISGGGIGVLDAETSRAWTASVVVTPDLWRDARLSLAVDYVDIKIEGQVAQLGAAAIVRGCYASEFFPTDPLCEQFTRVNDPQSPDDNRIPTVRDPFLNINSQSNRAVDVTARFSQDLGNLGEVSLLAQMTWQLEDRFELFEGTETDNNGEVGDPEWVGDFSAAYTKDQITVVYGLDVIGATSDREDLIETRGDVCFNNTFRGGVICPDTELSAAFYHNLSITYDVNEDYEFTFGIANLTDRGPSRASTVFSGIGAIGQAPISGSYYDYLGRRAFIRANARF